MRFFLASLLLAAAAIVSADSGDKIGSIHTDQMCTSKGVDLIDNKCTPYPQGSINLTADAAICFAFPDEDCNEPTITPDSVKFEKGCELTEKLAGGKGFLTCYGESRKPGKGDK
ncbi:hypothetical protein H112_05916 [Trichophyton rubrum D6]|nr:uncharacterized protein TERG_03622 [Trichophyton rubrum CBS 118892]EZF15148.1 hypothetical protein H100_05931 [Trichophyton rubrum MR850]EZF40041.1 hypothetical protein H102_05901 [Trichophyton rubrum CBS 100081]EZF50663.1 hypothetical protein H103_05927 [Trichophyton rubrum CBS 288.86]EZF61273.1 hypothetical protein H104_05913 [Trichophyton rubrum CBS 289.86]EZF71924.1 hypothetical protein H105_05942 [Trichophyton soudanense CBS 452.61]EZF82597.1 hypothetical protein H110_05921 [Trichophy